MANNAVQKSEPQEGHDRISEQCASTEARKAKEIGVEETRKQKELQFKASHTLFICFLLWIFSLQGIGIYFFTKGFLLTRLVLENKSNCAFPPGESYQHNSGSYSEGCWHPKTFSKAVVIIIDALRYDFTIPYYDDDAQHFHNAMTVLYETAIQTPRDAFLLPFIADPPTTTLQRLKGLTTGTLPTFVDSGSNFAGTAIEEDNLVAQLRDAGKTMVHLGDDTWQALFPGYFDANLTHAYDSFNVWDLHTVDNGVTEHIIPLLSPSEIDKWDVVFGHYLGVDHAGHQYGPNHPAMASKLKQMDDVLREIIALLGPDTLLVVMGDHGMDAKGDHGGESDDEVEAALWMYSKKGIFGREQDKLIEPPRTAKERPVAQIDLVPSLSLLLGLPIPFNNLGAPISEAFVGPGRPDWQNLATVNALTAAQIHRYQHDYSTARNQDESLFSIPLALWRNASGIWLEAIGPTGNADKVRASFSAFSQYQKQTLGIFKSLWAIFDIPSMLLGIGILAFTILILAIYARSTTRGRVHFTPIYLGKVGSFGIIGAIAGGMVLSQSIDMTVFDACLLGFVAGGITGFSFAAAHLKQSHSIPIPDDFWGWLSFVFTLGQAIGFASNSYTIWEDEILLFFLGTFATVSIVSSTRQTLFTDRVLGITQSTIFILLTRLSSFSRLCREEQMPTCRSTYYASSTSSTSAPWQLLIPLAVALFLPSFIKSYYQWTRSYEGSAVFWIGFAFRMGLLGSAVFWTLNSAESGGWISVDSGILKTVNSTLAQLVLAVAFAAGTTTFVWAKPCIRIEVSSASKSRPEPQTLANPKALIVLGYANVHGSRYFLLVVNWALAITLLQKPMGSGAVSLLTLQILALVEIIDTNNLSSSAIGPVILGLLGNFHFFKTGHQATPSSIQWDSAFIPLKTIIYPWSPLLIVLNTFGAQILTTVAVPLVVLWKQSPKKRGLLEDVTRAIATNGLYYAVINLATSMWAGWLRRHLMLYRIFSPRFMVGAAVLMVVDLVGVFIALGGVRWNFLSVAEVFGWE
ncbi:mannose-ethanolamine phosphotransferase gpi13 [Pseudocyphellaria aurata]|nr:mannose-ethanolamine phosphotransferase gpi13 [Pseudocyphellaria aurata]